MADIWQFTLIVGFNTRVNCPKCSKFVKCVRRKSSDTNWFGQAAQQVADHGAAYLPKSLLFCRKFACLTIALQLPSRSRGSARNGDRILIVKHSVHSWTIFGTGR